jgi:hypothetical protein
MLGSRGKGNKKKRHAAIALVIGIMLQRTPPASSRRVSRPKLCLQAANGCTRSSTTASELSLVRTPNGCGFHNAFISLRHKKLPVSARRDSRSPPLLGECF